MDSTTIFAAPHRLRNPLTGAWLLVAPQCLAYNPAYGSGTNQHTLVAGSTQLVYPQQSA